MDLAAARVTEPSQSSPFTRAGKVSGLACRLRDKRLTAYSFIDSAEPSQLLRLQTAAPRIPAHTKTDLCASCTAMNLNTALQTAPLLQPFPADCTCRPIHTHAVSARIIYDVTDCLPGRISAYMAMVQAVTQDDPKAIDKKMSIGKQGAAMICNDQSHHI